MRSTPGFCPGYFQAAFCLHAKCGRATGLHALQTTWWGLVMTVADKQIQIVTCGGVVGVILSGQIAKGLPPVSATTETGP